MSQFPNYFPMNNYPQNYGQPMQNPYNPYMQRMDQLQQFQQAINQSQMPTQVPVTNHTFSPLGKIVESIDIVKATDIPMDGNLYYFPKADNSEIYAKQWLPNGTTQILSFKPVFDDGQASNGLTQESSRMGLSDDLINVLMQRFDEMSERFDKLEKSIKPTARNKREVADE